MDNQSQPHSCRRIMVFGRPGSGKSTFAARLHNTTGLPLYHLDRYFYTQNWAERNYEEFLAFQQNIVHQDAWIIDGNCTKSLEMRYQRATICLYFNYARWKCYLRIFKRFLTKDKNIHDRALGCKETIRWSLLTYTWSFQDRVATKISELQKQYPSVSFREIKNNNDLMQLEAELCSKQ